MGIKITIDEHEFSSQVDRAIKNAVYEFVEPKIAEYLKSVINTEEVAKIIEERIKTTLSYGVYSGDGNRMSEHGIGQLFSDRIIEISKNITDKELKDFLFEAIFNRVVGKS